MGRHEIRLPDGQSLGLARSDSLFSIVGASSPQQLCEKKHSAAGQKLGEAGGTNLVFDSADLAHVGVFYLVPLIPKGQSEPRQARVRLLDQIVLAPRLCQPAHAVYERQHVYGSMWP